MKKLVLKLDSIEVHSFATAPADAMPGIVRDRPTDPPGC